MPPMTDRRRSPFRHAARLALVPALLALAACSSIAGTDESTPTTALDPTYRSVIAKHLKTMFKDLSTSNAVEISEPRWLQSNKAWAWSVCVHFQDRGHRRTYIVFFKGSEFVDERYAVQVDACDAQSYSALDMGGMSRGVGDPGPLY
jgi:hypothetical protein